jgi:hypothetical protein
MFYQIQSMQFASLPQKESNTKDSRRVSGGWGQFHVIVRRQYYGSAWQRLPNWVQCSCLCHKSRNISTAGGIAFETLLKFRVADPFGF